MKKIILYLNTFLLLFFFSCSGPSSLYNFDTPLSSEKANSKSTSLQVNIPHEWFTAEDNKENKIDLWLIKNDYSASISFIRINPDKETKQSLGRSDLEKIGEYSRLNHKLAHLEKFIDLLKNEVFELNGREFLAYQYAGAKNLYRVVVFKYRELFYECIASIKPGLDSNEQKNIFSIQNSVLSSIK